MALIQRAADRCRRSLQDAYYRVLPPIEADLLSGIVLGQRTRLPSTLTDDFAATVLDGAAPALTRDDTVGNMRVLDEIRRQIGLRF